MALVQAGDEQKFDLLARRYHDRLWKFAASKLHDPQQAEDVVQDALLAAFAARASYSPRFAFSTWMWTILLNLCRKVNKAASRRNLVQREFVHSIAGGHGELPSQRLEQVDESSQLAGWLGRLPEEEADALRLKFFGGLKFEEIALAMDSSVSGAKVRVKRGLARLAEIARNESKD